LLEKITGIGPGKSQLYVEKFGAPAKLRISSHVRSGPPLYLRLPAGQIS
jgi:hypothetical protein